MTVEKLKSQCKKDLAALAKKKGVPGWHAMRKDQLIKVLASLGNGTSKRERPTPVRHAAMKVNGVSTKADPPPLAKNGSRSHATSSPGSGVGTPSPGKDLARSVPPSLPDGYGRDRIVLMVRDPYWVHVYWEITRAAVERAEAALNQEWHTAKPVLRLFDVSTEDVTAAATAHVRDIEIHGGANNWYIEVNDPPRSYRVDVGYVTQSGRFYALARSNVVTTPRAGVSDVIDENWVTVQEQFEKIYRMSGGLEPGASSMELRTLFEERLRRPLGSAALSSFGSGAMPKGRKKNFWFQIDAELIVYGSTAPDARVTLQGEPVKLRQDGTFTMRFALPDGRQIIPASASSTDGCEQRTVVLAIERNTRELEPVSRESND